MPRTYALPCGPTHCCGQTRIEGNPWLPAYDGTCPGAIGVHMALLALPLGCIQNCVVRTRATEGGQSLVGQLIDGEAATAADVENQSIAGGIFERRYPRLHCVLHIHKVARLIAVTKDGD